MQVATALEVTDALDERLHAVRRQLLDAARHLVGAQVLAARIYGVGLPISRGDFYSEKDVDRRGGMVSPN